MQGLFITNYCLLCLVTGCSNPDEVHLGLRRANLFPFIAKENFGRKSFGGNNFLDFLARYLTRMKRLGNFDYIIGD